MLHADVHQALPSAARKQVCAGGLGVCEPLLQGPGCQSVSRPGAGGQAARRPPGGEGARGRARQDTLGEERHREAGADDAHAVVAVDDQHAPRHPRTQSVDEGERARNPNVLASIASPRGVREVYGLSPDGKMVCFEYLGDLWTASIAGGDANRLTVHPAYDAFPSWSPDGNWIAYSDQGRLTPEGILISKDKGKTWEIDNRFKDFSAFSLLQLPDNRFLLSGTINYSNPGTYLIDSLGNYSIYSSNYVKNPASLYLDKDSLMFGYINYNYNPIPFYSLDLETVKKQPRGLSTSGIKISFNPYTGMYVLTK